MQAPMIQCGRSNVIKRSMLRPSLPVEYQALRSSVSCASSRLRLSTHLRWGFHLASLTKARYGQGKRDGREAAPQSSTGFLRPVVTCHLSRVVSNAGPPPFLTSGSSLQLPVSMSGAVVLSKPGRPNDAEAPWKPIWPCKLASDQLNGKEERRSDLRASSERLALICILHAEAQEESPAGSMMSATRPHRRQ